MFERTGPILYYSSPIYFSSPPRILYPLSVLPFIAYRGEGAVESNGGEACCIATKSREQPRQSLEKWGGQAKSLPPWQ